MIELSTLWAMLIAALPTLAAIVGIIVSVIKVAKDNKQIVQPVIDQFNNLRKEVQDKTEMVEIKDQLLALLVQNRQKDQMIADLITEMRKQKYELPDKEV